MRTKKLLTAILTMALLLSLFACGEMPEETTQNKAETTEKTSSTSGTENEETTEKQTDKSTNATESTESEVTAFETETTATDTATETRIETETETVTETETETDPQSKYSEGLNFSSNGNGTCYISGIGSCTDIDIIIPETSPRMEKVTGIDAYAFHNNKDITSVTIPRGVEFIGALAFKGCANLKQVNIPESVTIIKNYAFANCSSLRSVTIEGVVVLESGAFSDCSDLREINLGEGLEFIGGSAFSGCKKLNSISIPDSVETIDHNAFDDCKSLREVEIGNGIKNIVGHVFSGCDNIVYNQDGGCNYLGNETNKYAVLMSVTDSTIEKIKLKDGIRVIYSRAFYQCSNLRKVVIPEGVLTIEDNVFVSCNSLNSITLPSSLEKIGLAAFFCCSNLESITIPENVTSIDSDAFYECTGLKSVIFENTRGWLCTDPYDVTERISSKKLSDPEIAATYLASTYVDWSWQRRDDLPEETTEDTTEETTEETTRFNYFSADMEEYISFESGALETIELEIDEVYIIDDEDVKEYVNYLIYINRQPVNGETAVTDLPLSNGDSAYVFYKLYIGADEYEDGSWWGEEEPEMFVVGNADYVFPGIDAQLLGMIPSSTSEEVPVKLSLTFPDDYWDDQLAGKTATIALWIVYSVQYELPEYNADFIVNVLEYEPSEGCEDVIAEFEASLYEDLVSENESFLELAKEVAVYEYLYNYSTVIKYPQSEYDFFYNSTLAEMESMRANYESWGTHFDSFDDFANYYFGIEDNDTDWRDLLDTDVKESIEPYLMSHGFAQAKNITLTDEDYRLCLEELTADSEMTPEDLESYLGEYEIRELALLRKVVAYIIENSTIIYQ